MFNDTIFIDNMIKEQIKEMHETWGPGERPLKNTAAVDLFWDSCIDNGMLKFNKIMFPDLRNVFVWTGFPVIYGDTIMFHHLYGDDYSSEKSNALEAIGSEGAYFMNEHIVRPGDVVIDAGAYIGDFSATAAILGANVHAFEPAPPLFSILNDVAKLNNFIAVPEALGDTVTDKLRLTLLNPAEDKIDLNKKYTDSDTVPCKMNTIDNYAMENDLHIDFIKADIEGFERYMLLGAKEVLKFHEPKLSIRTYHNKGEDRDILPKIVSDINPKYKFKFNGHTMFASVDG